LTSPEELCAALRRFGLENDRLDAIVARRLGAPPVEFKAMDHLHEAGELTPTQLAERLALTSGAVTAVIDRLERLGWVTRQPHPTDRRSVIVRKAAGIGGEAADVYASFGEEVARAAKRLSPKERAATARFLEEASAAAVRHAQQARSEKGLRGSPGSGPAPTG
jgi:DNA-binding MarR family transcriptional regulator